MMKRLEISMVSKTAYHPHFPSGSWFPYQNTLRARSNIARISAPSVDKHTFIICRKVSSWPCEATPSMKKMGLVCCPSRAFAQNGSAVLAAASP